ncbi:GNAT family N-acetyltransferase [bacterium]|nr:GNAT family N-acetyltransferase [bacterium]
MDLTIRPCAATDQEAIFAVINDAAEAYRGVIPADCWHEPYLSRAQLQHEIADGVCFWGAVADGALIGVMGIQDQGEVCLIRHAYVRTARRQQGIGTRLLRHLESMTAKPILIGTWTAATWAVSFYRQNGYRRLSRPETNQLLRRYWKIPDRQIETSVVLASRRWPSGPRPGCTPPTPNEREAEPQ